MHWLITDKGDPDARRLVDGEVFGLDRPHYSRQSPGARLFTRNGQNLVFITEDSDAVWVTFRPTPGIATRPDKREVWECALFRNESPFLLSSDLIVEAEELSVALWGSLPREGLITFVVPAKIKSVNPGYCYKCAGWTIAGASSDGKPMLLAPSRPPPRDRSAWRWKEGRGGKLRRLFEECAEALA